MPNANGSATRLKLKLRQNDMKKQLAKLLRLEAITGSDMTCVADAVVFCFRNVSSLEHIFPFSPLLQVPAQPNPHHFGVRIQIHLNQDL